jgi:hypothetical protein
MFELPILAGLEFLANRHLAKGLADSEAFPEGIKTHEVVHVNDPSCHKLLEELQPRGAFVYGSSIVGKKSLSLLGKVLNAHMGIVPQYRGAKSELWALYRHEDDQVGFSIHECVSELDGGSLVFQARVAPSGGPSACRVKSLICLGVEFPKVWNLHMKGKSEPLEQVGEVGLYSTPRLGHRLKLAWRRGFLF